MKSRRARIVLGIGTILLTGLLFSYWRSRLNSAREAKAILAAEQADETLVSTLRAAIPMGSTLAQVRRDLEARKLDVPDYFNNQLLLARGTEPSQVWYCGPISRYVTFSFVLSPDGDPQLKSIARETRGDGLPDLLHQLDC